MKRATLPTAAAAIFVVVIAALFAQHAIGNRALSLHQSAQNAHQAVSAIRGLEIRASRLQYLNGSLEHLHQRWNESRRETSAAIAQVVQSFRHVAIGREHARRAADMWAGIESRNAELDQLLNQLVGHTAAGAFELSGMTLAYNRILHDPKGDPHLTRTLGLALNLLDDLDRRIEETEAELHLLAGLASRDSDPVRAQQRHITLGIGACVILGIAFFLHRIALAHASVTRENAARLAAEQAAASKERDLQITLDSIGDAVISTDTEGRVVRMNPVAETLTGWSVAEAGGLPLDSVFVIINERTREPVSSPVRRVLLTGSIVGLDNQTILRHRNGSERSIADSAAPIRDANGVVRGVVLVFRDVTGQYRLERQIREAQKMDSVGQLAGGIAHDFNNLLQVISGNLSLARDPAARPDDTAACLQEIGDATRRAAELCQQLLAFGRRQALEKKVVNLAQNVSAALKMIRRVIGENVTVEFHQETVSPLADVDPGQIDQVLLNLCINARDAMPEGGRLKVGLSETVLDETGVGEHPGAKPGPYLVLAVSDSGTGMDRDTIQRIFDPFFTSKPLGKGTGLGLAVVQGIVHQHGGFIVVRSTPGLGSTFEVHLPASRGAAAQSPDRGEGAPGFPSAGGGATVLLAEDEAAVRTVAARLLQRFGYRVLEATEGEEACTLAASHEGPIAFAMIDMVMPRLGGAETARRLQALRPGLPVIIATGYAAGFLGGKELTRPGWSLLRKPYSVAELALAIEKIQPSQG